MPILGEMERNVLIYRASKCHALAICAAMSAITRYRHSAMLLECEQQRGDEAYHSRRGSIAQRRKGAIQAGAAR